jgi:hypothetical protein
MILDHLVIAYYPMLFSSIRLIKRDSFFVFIFELFRLEKEIRDEMKLNLKNLLFFLEDFVYVGYNELNPSTKSEMFQIPGFKMPKPLGKGRTIQNIYAFQCLLNIFNKVIIIRTLIHLSLSLSLSSFSHKQMN